MTVKAAVPSFAGTIVNENQRLDNNKPQKHVYERQQMPGGQNLLMNRVSQPVVQQSPSPYLDAEDFGLAKGPNASSQHISSTKRDQRHASDGQVATTQIQNCLQASKGNQTAKRKRQLSDLLDNTLSNNNRGDSRQASLAKNSSFVREEGRKAGLPKESAEQHGKYGKKAAPKTSLL